MGNARTGILAAIMSCLSLLAPLGVLAAAQAPPPSDPMRQMQQDLKEASALAEQDKSAEAWAIMQRVIDSPALPLLREEGRCAVLRFAGALASYQQDSLSAVESLSISSECADATAEDWILLLRNALALERWDVCGRAVLTVARRWPKSLEDLPPNTIGLVQTKLKQDPRNRPLRIEMMQALFDAHWTSELGLAPDRMWQSLGLEYLADGREREALAVVAGIEDAETLARMRVDKRFSAIVARNPSRFAINKAVQADVKRLRKAVKDHPHSLWARSVLANKLYRAGAFAEELQLMDDTLREVNATQSPPFEDTESELPWIKDNRARALKALGRFSDAAAQLEDASHMMEHRQPNVSQAINLGYLYADIGKPTDALRAVDSVDWTKGISDYGRTQLMAVRHRAFLQLNQPGEGRRRCDISRATPWIHGRPTSTRCSGMINPTRPPGS